MYINRSRGFTLIELLVVIAIIGILSSVVLASLNTARNKGNDAAVQSNLESIRVEAELFYGATDNTYGSTAGAACDTALSMFVVSAPIKNAIVAAEVANGASNVTCGSDTDEYAVASPLSSVTGYWCVDSTGFGGKRSTVLLNGAKVCPAS